MKFKMDHTCFPQRVRDTRAEFPRDLHNMHVYIIMFYDSARVSLFSFFLQTLLRWTGARINHRRIYSAALHKIMQRGDERKNELLMLLMLSTVLPDSASAVGCPPPPQSSTAPPCPPATSPAPPPPSLHCGPNSIAVFMRMNSYGSIIFIISRDSKGVRKRTINGNCVQCLISFNRITEVVLVVFI